MTETVTNRGKYLAMNGGWAALDIRALIFTGTQTGTNDPDLNTVADLDAVTSVAIHTERLALASEAYTEDDTNNRVNGDCANLSFAASVGTTAQGLALYDEGGGTDATRDLLSIHTTGFPASMDGGINVTINDFVRLS